VLSNSTARTIVYRGFTLYVHRSGWTRIIATSVHEDQYTELPDLLLNNPEFAENAYRELDVHLQKYGFDSPEWLEGVVSADGIPWEIHRIADKEARDIAMAAWRTHRV